MLNKSTVEIGFNNFFFPSTPFKTAYFAYARTTTLLSSGDLPVNDKERCFHLKLVAALLNPRAPDRNATTSFMERGRQRGKARALLN